MKTIYIVRNYSYSYSHETEIYKNERAFLTQEKAEQFIADYKQSIKMWRRKDELNAKWARYNSKFGKPEKDVTLHRTRENLYKTKSLIDNKFRAGIEEQIQILNDQIKEIDKAHTQAILEYERNRLAKKEEFSLTLSEEDRNIFMNDNITKPEEKEYDIEELEMEE